LLAIGGASSLIFATACLTPLSNLVQGLVIAVSRPFATGDKISIGSMSPLIGLVEHFGWYQSRLRTANNELVVLPNSMLAKEQVVNLSRRTSKKIQATFRVRYDDLPKVHPLLEEL
ncbi:hypothetical protein EMIHUDRAFT_57591, partial [Emiliania huxleyi CCMP1516]|uniref:Mechanosensitive ion channel MscS domain-containing protein n=2 Tax=Emiliania huxleyi TaxID=2903 RepID=A0A0D3IYE0_EMIH1